MDRYKKIRTIGKGGFAKVYLVKDSHNQAASLVMKVIEVGGMSREEQSVAKNEVQILASLNHPNIIGYHDSFLHNNKINIVMEHAPNGDLHGKIQKQGARTFPEQRINSWLGQILAATQHLHALKMIHRDIKPQNVFLTANDNAKIGDFGITKVMQSQAMARTQIGTPFYISPEICQSKPYDMKSDIWALGCLAHELCTLKPPFMADDLKGMMKKICYAKAGPIAAFYSQPLRETIIAMMNKDQRKRPSARRLMAMPLFAEHAPPDHPPPVTAASSNSSGSIAPSVASSARSRSEDQGPTNNSARHGSQAPAHAKDIAAEKIQKFFRDTRGKQVRKNQGPNNNSAGHGKTPAHAKDIAAGKIQKFFRNTRSKPQFRENPRSDPVARIAFVAGSPGWRDNASKSPPRVGASHSPPRPAAALLGAAAERGIDVKRPVKRGSSFPRDASDDVYEESHQKACVDAIQHFGRRNAENAALSPRERRERGSYPPHKPRRHSFDNAMPEDRHPQPVLWEHGRKNNSNLGEYRLPDVAESRPPPMEKGTNKAPRSLDAGAPGAYPGANPVYAGRSRRRVLQRQEENPHYVLPQVDDAARAKLHRVRKRRGSI